MVKTTTQNEQYGYIWFYFRQNTDDIFLVFLLHYQSTTFITAPSPDTVILKNSGPKITNT